MTGRRYMVRAGDRTLSVSAFVWPDGKIEQFLVERAE